MRRSTDPLDPVPLRVDISRTPGRAGVRLTGEVDLMTAGRLADVLDDLLDQGCRTVEVDLCGVRFLAAAGLTVLVEAECRFRQRSGRLLLVGPTPACLRLFRLTSLEGMLTIR